MDDKTLITDYISLKDAINTVRTAPDMTGDEKLFVIKRLKAIPAADVAPVVHAKWEWNEDGMDCGIGSWVCGNCKARPETLWQEDESIVPYWWSGGHFCPNCGAKMEVGE